MRQAVSAGLLLLCLASVEGGGRDRDVQATRAALRELPRVERIADYVLAHQRARARLRLTR